MARRRGDSNAFWNNVAVGAGGKSSHVSIGRGGENLVIYMTVSGITTVSVEVAHSSDLNSDGSFKDEVTTQLNGAVTLPTTPITVDSTAAFASSGTIQIGDQLVTYSGKTATTFTGASGGAGTFADNTVVTQTPTFFPLFIGTGASANKVEVAFSGAGSAALIVPDFGADFVRLSSSAAVTITAGWEAEGD